MRRFAPPTLIALALLTALPSGAEEEASEERSTEQEQVVTVQGTVPRVAAEPEVSASVAQGEALREPGSEIDDVLARQPGVQVNRTGSASDVSTVSIRGDAGAQVPVYLAGIRLNDDLVGVADLSRIPLFMVERLEVYRGAVPLRGGRGGTSGAILVEPTLPRDQAARIGASAGSFGYGAIWAGLTGVVGGQKADDDARLSTTVAVRRAGAQNDYSYPSDAGTAFDDGDDARQKRENDDFIDSDVWLISRGVVPLGADSATTTLLFNHFDREKGVPGLAVVPATAARAKLEQDLLGVTSVLPCGGKGCRVSLSSSLLSSHLVTTDPESELALGASSIDQVNQRTEHEAGAVMALSPLFEVQGAANFESARIAVDSPTASLARADENYFGFLGSVLASFGESFSVRAVGRASCSHAEGEDESNLGSGEHAAWSKCHPEGRLGASVSPLDSVSLRALVARGVRYPTLGERFGISAVTRGNEDLAVEKAWSADVGSTVTWTRKSTSGWVDVAVFARKSDDLVAFRRSSLGYVRPYNVGEARFFGGELSAEGAFVEHLRARTDVSLLDPRDVSDSNLENDLIPFRSQLTASQELEVFTRGIGGTFTHLGLTAYLTYRSGRVADPAGLIVIPEQFVVDLGARAEVMERLSLRLRAENLFQAARFDALGFPLPGRAVFLSAELRTAP